MRLVLWDIDGTLMNSGGMIREARGRALRSVYGIEGEIRRVAVGGGMTDPQLTLETVALHGWAEHDAIGHLDRFRDTYLADLETTKHLLSEDLVVIPGVTDAIERLHALGVLQALLTGNYEPAARLKVGAVGLDRLIDPDLGAYGSDNRDRDRLVPVALEKVQRLRDPSMTASDIIVIGDSPRDIACARAGGARAVAVATSTHSMAELAEHHPDALLERLDGSDETMAALLGG